MQASIDFDGTLTGSIAGGGGGGSDVSITPTYHQGTKIADYSIDGNEGAIYTPEIEITKYVSSGIKLCEIEGVEIFAPSCGYIDTLGDSNIEQIGGFSQGANVTPVNVKRVSYTNDVSNGEKIGSLTVGDSSYNIYQKPNSNINYSTTEQNTGRKWIDGRYIYQKTFAKQITITTANRTWYEILSSVELTEINCDIILNYDNSYISINDEIYNFNYSSVLGNVGAMLGVYQNKTLNKVEVCITAMDTGTFDIVITIQYLKAV
jgi:hypothetical protein